MAGVGEVRMTLAIDVDMMSCEDLANLRSCVVIAML